MAKRFAKGNTMLPNIVKYITQRVIDKFKEEYLLEKGKPYEYVNDAVLYGYGTYDSNEFDSIRTYLCKKPEVQEVVTKYLKDKGLGKREVHQVIEGNYLWKKNHEAKKNPLEPIPFKEHYRDIFLKYIGADMAEIEHAYQDSYTNFVGYYLSFADFKIKTILLRVSNTYDAKGQHEVIVEGVHAKKNATKDDTYEGKVWMEEGWLYGYGKGRDLGRRISLMGSVKRQEPIINNPIIRVFLQGITYDAERLFSWEVLFHRLDRSALEQHRTQKFDEIGPLNPLAIGSTPLGLTSLYLTLHRNTMSFRSERVSDIQKIQAKTISVSDIAHIVGTYRLWNIDYEFKNIVQSSFSVLNDEVGLLRTFVPFKDQNSLESVPSINWRPPIAPNLRNQRSLINISRANKSSGFYKVVAVTFFKIDIVNVAMFDFPTENTYSNDKIISGTFSTLSDQSHGNFSAYFVMKKVEGENITTESNPIEKVLQGAKSNGTLDLLIALLEINVKNCVANINENGAKMEALLMEAKKQITPKSNPPSENYPMGWE